MNIESKAYCPASISLVFNPFFKKSPINSGSTGVGFTLNEGITATVSRSDKNIIIFNDEIINLKTLSDSISEITPENIKVILHSKLPLGGGFGLSSASSLSTVFAVNKLLHLKKSPLELSRIVHISEIQNKTGLGTATTQITGGFLVKTTPGIHFNYSKFNLSGKKIYILYLGQMNTPEKLKDKKNLKLVKKQAEYTLDIIHRKNIQKLLDFLDLSYDFTVQSEILTDTILLSIIKKVKNIGGHASMLIFGNALVSDIPIPKPYPKMSKYYKLSISNMKPNIIQ